MLPCFCLPGGMCVHVLACVPLAISGTAVLMGSHSECLLVRLWVQCCVRCKVCLALSALVSRWCVFLRHRVVCLVVSFVAQDGCVSGSECLSRLSCAYHGMTFCFCASAGFVCVCDFQGECAPCLPVGELCAYVCCSVGASPGVSGAGCGVAGCDSVSAFPCVLSCVFVLERVSLSVR